MAQSDKAEKISAERTSKAWGRKRMNKPHRKGRKHAKKVVTRARRRLDDSLSKKD